MTLLVCLCSGYFDAPGSDLCPLIWGGENGPDVPDLPVVTMTHCSIDNFKAMKVSTDRTVLHIGTKLHLSCQIRSMLDDTRAIKQFTQSFCASF